ncbi:OmpA family protein [Prevotella cerevisiae]|uniref:OmpA family protein n=1 Tax=Segatella cerevisiae TaxID=2053716 RepID=A0ABT1BZN4_9BACT|nr:OmpA family protein [Segatella cerevisiae]MCO6026550.1 OmpA family protein [Segatella cerevisiae]
MKKLVLLLAAATMAVSASAQTVAESKTFDNWYVGINGGVTTKTTGHNWMGGLNPNAGLRVGRYFTPVFGLAVESNAYFSNKPYASSKTGVRFLNTSLLGTINFSNWFGGYKGAPRFFEVGAVYGLGWGHSFGNAQVYTRAANKSNDFNFVADHGINSHIDNLSSKVGLDFQFNLGEEKAWQIYVEPSITYALNGDGYDGTAYNVNRSFVQLNAGVIYKFKNSNGTHNFAIAQLRDQSEIDGLNSQINNLRNSLNDKDAQLSAKDKQIEDLQNALNARPKYEKPATATNLQPTVLFRQGKSVIDPAQYAPIELISQYMKHNKAANVEIKGYASPEGSAAFNQKLSELRAEAVKKALVKKYRISSSRLTTKGMGATDKLFKQVEFNRVVTFNDNAAQE